MEAHVLLIIIIIIIIIINNNNNDNNNNNNNNNFINHFLKMHYNMFKKCVKSSVLLQNIIMRIIF